MAKTPNVNKTARLNKDARDKLAAPAFGSLEDWRIYVVIGVSVVAIGGLIVANVLNSLKGSTTVACVQTMAMFTLALEEMHEKVGFDIDPEAAGDATVMRAIYHYYKFGEAAFESDADGALVRPLRLKSADQLAALTPIEREHFVIDRLPPCSGGGAYHFERSAPDGDGVPVVVCSEHGRFGRPDPKGRYQFDGRLRDLEPRETSMGMVATLTLPAQFKPPIEQIPVIAAGKADVEGEAIESQEVNEE